MAMILNQKAIDAINKAKELVAVRRELKAEYGRTSYGLDPSRLPPEIILHIGNRIIKLDRELRQVQQTILIHLGAERD